MNIEKYRKTHNTTDVRTFLKGKEKNLLEHMILEKLYIIHDKKFSYQIKQKTWDEITLKFNSQSEIKKNRQQIRKWYKNNRSYLLGLGSKTNNGMNQKKTGMITITDVIKKELDLCSSQTTNSLVRL
jgi:predicted chitinase